MEEMRVKTQVQTDLFKTDLFKTWFLEVQGARPSELTRKLATTALNIYCIHILSFSAYLPQLAVAYCCLATSHNYVEVGVKQYNARCHQFYWQ